MNKTLLNLLMVAAVTGSLVDFHDAEAGRLPSPGAGQGSLQPGESHVSVSTFEEGVFANVTVEGTGDGDIDCYALDEDGKVVGSDDDPTNTCLVTWIPKKKGSYRFRVINNGKHPVSYKLETN